jgi:hypothetical protein
MSHPFFSPSPSPLSLSFLHPLCLYLCTFPSGFIPVSPLCLFASVSVAMSLSLYCLSHLCLCTSVFPLYPLFIPPLSFLSPFACHLLSDLKQRVLQYRVGILKQNAKSRYSGIPGFEVRRNSKKIAFAQLFFLKHDLISALSLLYTAWVAEMLAIMISTPQVWDSILSYSTIIKFKLFTFLENQFTFTITGEKWRSTVRSDNRFNKSNSGISATMKCFWIPTLYSRPTYCDYRLYQKMYVNCEIAIIFSVKKVAIIASERQR